LRAIDFFPCDKYNFFYSTAGIEKMNYLCVSIFLIGMFFPFAVYGEMYQWVDEKGTVHFADDLSNIPEKYRADAEEKTLKKETSTPTSEEKSKSSSSPPILKPSEPEGIEVALSRRGEVFETEVLLNERVKRFLIVDSGASFMLISPQTAKELELMIDENTPFIPMGTVSGSILTPLVTLKSVRVGKAEASNIEAVIHPMPSGGEGLLGNSFLNKFRVVLDSIQDKMTLLPMQGIPSPDRPGGYGKGFWVSQFRFYRNYLELLRKYKKSYEDRGATTGSDLNRVNKAIRYFESQLEEWERKASFAGVPRNWRE
jgi:clan AA aspartic protease (TIGR02281 family)